MKEVLYIFTILITKRYRTEGKYKFTIICEQLDKIIKSKFTASINVKIAFVCAPKLTSLSADSRQVTVRRIMFRAKLISIANLVWLMVAITGLRDRCQNDNLSPTSEKQC